MKRLAPVVLWVLACGTQTVSSDQVTTDDSIEIPSDAVLFYDENTGVFIELPAGWRVETTRGGSIDFYNYPEPSNPSDFFPQGDMRVNVDIDVNTNGITSPSAFIDASMYSQVDVLQEFETEYGGKAVFIQGTAYNSMDGNYISSKCIVLCSDIVIRMNAHGDSNIIPDNLRAIAETIRVR